MFAGDEGGESGGRACQSAMDNTALEAIEGLRNVSPEVLDMFDPHRHPHQALRHRLEFAFPASPPLQRGFDSTETGGKHPKRAAIDERLGRLRVRKID